VLLQGPHTQVASAEREGRKGEGVINSANYRELLRTFANYREQNVNYREQDAKWLSNPASIMMKGKGQSLA
jgi:hypothetical protein